MGVALRDEETWLDVCKAVDADGSGIIDEDEFVDWVVARNTFDPVADLPEGTNTASIFDHIAPDSANHGFALARGVLKAYKKAAQAEMPGFWHRGPVAGARGAHAGLRKALRKEHGEEAAAAAASARRRMAAPLVLDLVKAYPPRTSGTSCKASGTRRATCRWSWR